MLVFKQRHREDAHSRVEGWTLDQRAVCGGTTDKPAIRRGRSEAKSRANVARCGGTEAKGPCFSLPECVPIYAHVCTLAGLTTTAKACLQSVHPYGREKETDSLSPQTTTCPTSKLFELPGQQSHGQRLFVCRDAALSSVH